MTETEGRGTPFIFKVWDRKKYIVDNDSDIFRDNLDIYNDGMIFGQFAVAMKSDDQSYRAVRDPLGIGKLFYCRDIDGDIHFSRRFTDLFHYGVKIYSIPAGYMVNITRKGIEAVKQIGPSVECNGELTLKELENNQAGIIVSDFRMLFRERLEVVYEALREKEQAGWKIFIALSGGLDSTIIAGLAAEYLSHPTACTLDLGKSEDSEKSAKIAVHIGIEHRIFGTDREEILSALDSSPRSCQDYRDFNVHCAALNILLARKIKEYLRQDDSIDPQKVIILTGDLMNEFTCDYSAEVIDGKEYYKLPRVDKKRLQQYLIGGLDTSDRELSPFAEFGLDCIQPYATIWDLYASLDEEVLGHGDPKKILNSFMVDDVIKGFIPKVKLRAQVGSRENMGILGLCHSLNMDDKTFIKNLLGNSGVGSNLIPLFVGRYDTENMNV